MTGKEGWQTAQHKKARGSLTQQLLDLAIETGSPQILDFARKAKNHTLGEEGVAKAWKLINEAQSKKYTHNPRRAQTGRAGTTRSSPQTAEKRALEQRAKIAKERLAKLERQ